MIDAEPFVQFGSLPFQQVGMPMPDPLTDVTYNLLAWEEDHRLLFVTTGTPLGAVAFRAEVTSSEPPLEEQEWDEWQEVSVQFDTGDVLLRSLDADDKVLLDTSLVDQPGRYRVRLYATGRASAVELQEPGDDLVERYLMQLWPESESRPTTPLMKMI